MGSVFLLGDSAIPVLLLNLPITLNVPSNSHKVHGQFVLRRGLAAYLGRSCAAMIGINNFKWRYFY
jgi:hypothetical protein